MMIEESLGQVLSRWKEVFGLYREFKTLAVPAVVRWEWTEGERYSFLPFYFKRFPGRARALKEPPTSPGYYFRYGLDSLSQPRIHYFYNYLDLQGEKRLKQDLIHHFRRDDLEETFYFYSDNLAEIIEFSVPPRIPLKVQQIFLENGKAIRHVSFRLNGYTPLYSKKGRNPDKLYEWLGPNGRFKMVEEYIYDRDRLTNILLFNEFPGSPPYKGEERFSYDDEGNLLNIKRHYENGHSQIVYQKRERGQTLQSIRATATQKLVEAVIERLRDEKISEKLFCIELSYQAVLHHFPPLIILGREEDRQRLLTSGNPDARFAVFVPALMGRSKSLEINDPDTLEICSRLEQEIQAGKKWSLAVDILHEVAAALTRFDWSELLDVTPDFVVFAIDWEMEGDHLADVLSTSASGDQIWEWKAKGWL